MKKFTLFTLLLGFFFLQISAQPELPQIKNNTNNHSSIHDENDLKIFPNPVKENRFQILSQKNIEFVELTNILGQKEHFEKTMLSPTHIEVIFQDKKDGVYLIMVVFEDSSKEVKRIIIN